MGGGRPAWLLACKQLEVEIFGAACVLAKKVGPKLKRTFFMQVVIRTDSTIFPTPSKKKDCKTDFGQDEFH